MAVPPTSLYASAVAPQPVHLSRSTLAGLLFCLEHSSPTSTSQLLRVRHVFTHVAFLVETCFVRSISVSHLPPPWTIFHSPYAVLFSCSASKIACCLAHICFSLLSFPPPWPQLEHQPQEEAHLSVLLPNLSRAPRGLLAHGGCSINMC